MKKLTLTLVLALLVLNTLALGGCELGKCLSCTGAADASTCSVCVGGSPKATTANPAVFDCSGTAIDGCLVNLTEGKCKVCDKTRILSLDKKSCVLPAAASVTIPSDTLCLSVAIIVSMQPGSNTAVCSCKGKSSMEKMGATPDCSSANPIIPNCEV